VTENNGEEPAEVAVEVQTAPPTKRGLRRPVRLDPGWATLVAAALALVGTLATVFYRGSGDAPAAKAVVESTAGATESSAATTSTSTTSTSTTSTSTTSTSTTSTSTTSTSAPPAAPTVNVVSGLPADQRESVNAIMTPLIAAANKLPLIVHDEFANNDYGWPQGKETYNGGIQCSWTIGQGAYDMAVHSVNGPAFCRSGLSKVTSDFVLSVDVHLRDERNSDIGLLFRFIDEHNYYEVVYTPQTQLMSVSFVGPDGKSPILQPTYVAEINPLGSNQMTLLALGDTILVSVNGTLVVTISNETRITSPGNIVIREFLNEPNADEVISLTRFELRGR
jgi:hypothetical protein